MKVGGSLWLNNTPITLLPQGLEVGGYLYGPNGKKLDKGPWKIAYRSSSVIDYPKPGLDPSIWNLDGTIKEDIKNFLLEKLGTFFSERGLELDKFVEDIVIIGSLTSYQYNRKSDLDVHTLVDLDLFKEVYLEELTKEELVELFDKTWRKELDKEKECIPDTKHPIEFYFEIEGETYAEKTDGVYSLLSDNWLQPPRTVEADFDVNTIYPEAIGFAEDIVKEMDVNLGEVKRTLEDLDYLQETIRQFDSGKKKIFKKKIEDKIEEIEESILEIVEKGQEVIEERKEDYSSESEANISFKYLQRYGYIWLVKNLEGVLEDKTTEKIEVEEDDIDGVEEVIDQFEADRLECNQSVYRKESLLFPKMELKILPKLSEEERNKKIDEIIEKGEDLNILYEYVGKYFTPQQIDKAIDKAIEGKYLYYLYEYVGDKFTPQQIDEIIEKGKYLWYLYQYAGKNFTPQQIDKAIDKGKDLWYLYQFVGENFTPEQMKRYEEKIKKKTSSRTCKRIVFMNL